MDSMEGLMERLKLTAMAKKRIKIVASASSRARSADPQAIGKVLRWACPSPREDLVPN